MGKRIAILFVILVLAVPARTDAARHGRRYKTLPDSEGELVGRVLKCLQNQDSIGYFNLFPSFDSLWQMVMHNPDQSPEAQAQLNALKEHPRTLVEFDPYYNPSIMERFGYVLKKGEDSGVNWNNIVLARYELQKEPVTRKLIGYDKVASERFIGYVFIRDLGGRTTFCVTLSEIQKFKGAFVGGQVNNIMEASTIEEYNRRVEYERNYFVRSAIAEADSAVIAAKADSLHQDSVKRGFIKLAVNDSTRIADSLAKKKPNFLSVATTDDDTLKIRREVVDRKYYEGKFDDEMPVEMLVRYMKDPQNGSKMYWDALYKFGDQQNYIKLEVTREGDKWEFDDDPPVGSMELILKNKVYTGSWVNNESQSGYDVVMKEMAVPPRKLEKMEKILEEGLSGRSDEASAPEEKPGDKKGKKKKDTKHSTKKSGAKDDDE
jgi:hypothetical protein